METRPVIPFRKHHVLMVSDFYFPNFGGVENHIYYLSQCLIQQGHKVVILTHAYGNRTGVRWMTNGLKVYYAPRVPFYLQNTFPTIWTSLPLVRCILVREAITVVHGHQAFSTLCHEALLHARTMGLPVVFTDHSLYGFADVGSIHMNKVLKFTLSDVHHSICVSHTSKENTVLRSGTPPHRVSVIPNAVDAYMFKPPRTADRGEPEWMVTVVVLSRLVYRKGVDLLVEVIPEVCRSYPQVRFIVGGDGPMRPSLEAMRSQFGLQHRVQMVGPVPHSDVRELLIRGRIFLNCSLTEAFCIALLEAASCGLLTVSTNVGGVPEVLPGDMMVLADPRPSSLVAAIDRAIEMLPGVDPWSFHERVSKMYSWHNVARRTEIVYNRVADVESGDLLDRLSRYYECGPWAGKLFCFVVVINHLFMLFLNWWQPIDTIEIAPNFPTGKVGSCSSDPILSKDFLRRHLV